MVFLLLIPLKLDDLPQVVQRDRSEPRVVLRADRVGYLIVKSTIDACNQASEY